LAREGNGWKRALRSEPVGRELPRDAERCGRESRRQPLAQSGLRGRVELSGRGHPAVPIPKTLTASYCSRAPRRVPDVPASAEENRRKPMKNRHMLGSIVLVALACGCHPDAPVERRKVAVVQFSVAPNVEVESYRGDVA